MSVFGLPQLGVFATLKLSPRNWNFSLSEIENSRNTESDMLQERGPLITFGPRLPNWPLPGCAKQLVVIDALQIVGVNQVASRPLPLVTSLGPKRFSVLLFPRAA